MTSDLTFTLFRLGYLVLLWLLVLGAVSTLRRDIFGTVVTPRGKGRKDADRKRRESRRSTHTSEPRNLLLTAADGRWWIEDLGSRNGTFVDDERLTSPRELNVGDIVRIGQTTLELVK